MKKPSTQKKIGTVKPAVNLVGHYAIYDLRDNHMAWTDEAREVFAQELKLRWNFYSQMYQLVEAIHHSEGWASAGRLLNEIRETRRKS